MKINNYKNDDELLKYIYNDYYTDYNDDTYNGFYL